MLKVLGFVRGTEHIAVGGIGLLGLHAVVETFSIQKGRHFGAAAEFLNELNVKPGLVDLQIRVDEKTVAVEAFDVVALIGRAVAPDVHAVVAHGGNQHRAGDGTADRRGVEVRNPGRGDMESPGLNGRNAFSDELRTAVDQARLLGTVLERAARNRFVVVLIGLAEVRRVGVRERALVLHPAQGCRSIETARKSDADLLADGNTLQNRLRHCVCTLKKNRRESDDRRQTDNPEKA